MLPLAFNTVLPSSMRVKHQLAIGVLPIGLMFLAFVPLFQLSAWLGLAMGIAQDAPIRSQPNAGWWIAIFLGSMVLGMVVGYLLGWLCNAAIARYVLRWPAQKVRAVFLHSEVPAHWLKEGVDKIEPMSASQASASKWAEQRQVGALRFILQRGVAAWGGPMFLAMYALPAWVRGSPFSLAGLAQQLALWAVAGALFGAAIWYASESNYRKLKSRDEA